ncbi:MAG: outer membrane protein assembly factor BamB, partial [Planctomycetaceae bacterium]
MFRALKVSLIVGLVAFAGFFPGGLSRAVADDWPQWGGPQRDLVWRETGIVDQLPDAEILPRVWSAPIGEGYGGPSVANGRVYVMDRLRDEQLERVLCLDAATGDVIWHHDYEARYSISYPAGPRCTPVVDGKLVYAVGAMGHMFCLKGGDGSVVWKRNFVDEFGTKLPTWGMVASPLVDGNQLITLVGGSDNSLVVSFDKTTGKELWRALQDSGVGYAPPVIFEFGGRRQLIMWHPDAVSSLDPANGSVIWQVPYRVRAGLSIATPRKFENKLFVASFYNGPRMIEVSDDGTSAAVVWAGKSDNEIR